ncbi:MAG: hypothetical protein O6826_11235 [Acidobacteria bacterium]|nr:hypothetical protein [Acidobacteriota bacterium]
MWILVSQLINLFIRYAKLIELLLSQSRMTERPPSNSRLISLINELLQR